MFRFLYEFYIVFKSYHIPTMRRKFCGRRMRVRAGCQKIIMPSLLTMLMLFLYNNLNQPAPRDKQTRFKTILSDHPLQSVNKTYKILMWTTFFGKWNWFEENKDMFTDTCPLGCTLTKDKTEIESADVVVFHLNDIAWQGQLRNWFSFSFPRYRHPDQVWILHNLEPPTMVWGGMGGWQGVFNWTWSYTRNSDIYNPYRQFALLNESERRVAAETIPKINFYSQKTSSGGIAMVSNCIDDARRYRIYEHLRKYMDIRVIGDCGEKCPGDYESCNDLLPAYRFYLAFENSDCDDYITEKYWRTLDRGQIPIVAWRLPMDGLVIPGSYVNVFDFQDLDAAGRHIFEINRNEALYNSFFRWRLTYKVVYKSSWCTICSMLTEGRLPRMVYHDMYGWLYNHTCKPVTWYHEAHRIWDRFTYDSKIH